MTNERKQEVLEQVELDVKIGFKNEQQLFQSIKDLFCQEKSVEEAWLEQVILQKYQQHQLESTTWTHPTSFEQLAKAFDELIQEGIVCLHNAGYTRSDGVSDCMEAVALLSEQGITAIGFCYYHTQDLASAIDPEGRHLYLGFDSPTQDENEAHFVADKIVTKLKQHGFQVNWPGTVDHRLEIMNIDWKKVPDDQEWGIERVLQLLLTTQRPQKPFWKFW